MVRNVFMTGATGYIGGSVLYALLKQPYAQEYKFTVLVRQKDKVKAFNDLGIRAVVGDLDSLELLREESANADIVVSTADADHIASVKAMISGMADHKRATGNITPFIHTSGTGVFVVYGKGRAPTSEDPVYDDSDADQIESLSDTALHRDVDLEILAADQRGDLLSYIVLPSTIYGIAPGDFGQGEWKGKIFNRHSQQMPLAISKAIERGEPGIVNEGRNVWPHVHINDLQELYTIVFDLAKDGKGDHGREGFYIGENGHYEYVKAAAAIGAALHKRGVGKAKPTSYTEKELDGNRLSERCGSLCQTKATRGKRYGWDPKHSTDDFYASLDEEVEYQLAKHEK